MTTDTLDIIKLFPFAEIHETPAPGTEPPQPDDEDEDDEDEDFDEDDEEDGA